MWRAPEQEVIPMRKINGASVALSFKSSTSKWASRRMSPRTAFALDALGGTATRALVQDAWYQVRVQ
jgi:hypothetical protein